jgi:hypothetical protein
MTRHLCQGPECHTYKTQSRVRGTKGAKVLRTRFARCEYTPEHRSFWEDYFCDERCLHAWLKVHLNNLMLSVGINTKPNETPVDVIKESYERNDWKGNPYTYTDTTIKLLSEQTNDDTITA